MAKSFEKRVVYSILGLVILSIGWLTSVPSTITNAAERPSATPTVNDVRVTATAASALPIMDTQRNTRSPWEWHPRIGGGSGIGVRDVGGYVYISTPSWRCNGALIDPEWVVTNAGCVTANRTTGLPMSAASITVVTGCYGVVDCVKMQNPLWYGTQSQVVGVSRVLIYQPTPKVPDVDMTIALVKLSSPVITGTGVNVVPIGESSDAVVGQSGLTVMSYGDIASNRGPVSLQRAVYSITNDSACNSLLAYRSTIHHCGAPTPQVCKSDWGAPVTRMVNGQALVYGILTSQLAVHGTSCPSNARSVTIDVTADEIRQWIATTIRQGRTGVIADQNGSGGLGSALARGNNRQHVIDIGGVFPQGIRIGGVTSTKLSINENGVITLGSMTSGIPSYIDIAKWSGGKAPIIVVFGADGDTSGTAQRGVIGGTSSGSNQVWVTQDVSRRVVVITWDGIRPMSTSMTGARAIGNSYQVELRAQENGDVKVTMRYGVIGWTAGATQCGTNCNGKYAQVGIADGRGKFQLGVPVVATSDVGLRQLTGKQLTFYLRDGVINRVNLVPPVRPTWTASPTRTLTSTVTPSMTVTLTSSATNTATATHTSTQTMTGTSTSTITPSKTATYTFGPTLTPIGQGLTNGLLGWYPLNGIRTSGSTLPLQATSVLGNVQYFDGVDDYHQMNANIANKSFTVAVWAKYETNPSITGSIVSIGSVITGNGVLHLGFRNTGQYICAFYEMTQSFTEYTPPPQFDRSEWHHYACTFDNITKNRSLYIDGNLVAVQNVPLGFVGDDNVYVGVVYKSYPQHVTYYKGGARDLFIYERTLAADEIQRLATIAYDSVMVTLPNATNSCRWVDVGGMVHEYEINHDLLTWEQSKVVAESKRRGGQRGYLATITSAEENECLIQLVDGQMGWTSGSTGNGPWIGAKRISTGGTFIWQGGPEKGMQLKSSDNGSPIGYDNWYVSEPNDATGLEDALIFGDITNKTWNDAPSTWLRKSIIEYTYSSSAMPLLNKTLTSTPTSTTTIRTVP